MRNSIQVKSRRDSELQATGLAAPPHEGQSARSVSKDCHTVYPPSLLTCEPVFCADCLFNQ